MNNKSGYFWIIVTMALIATSLSFLDRQVLSILIIKIKSEISISNVQYGFINTGFLIGYSIMFTVGGVLIDKYGSRPGLAVSVGIWSLATALHSLANNVMQFGIFRFMLGIGEGGAFPGAIKAVTEWVPRTKQALANGIAIGGAALGAVIAPPLCVSLINVTGWRGVFSIVSIIGFMWVGIWLLVTRKKNRNSENLTGRDIHDGGPEIPGNAGQNQINLLRLLKTREVWVFVVMRFLLDPILYFYMFWIPKYLNETHSTGIEQIGRIFWIPFLALGVSNILGGWISDALFSKTRDLNISRKIIMGVAALLMFPVLFVRVAMSPGSIILIITIAFFAHGLWITNYITAISDTFGRRVTSTVIGLSGTAGAISAFVINPVTGLIITKFSYNPIWIYAGSMYLVAFVVFTIMIPKIKILEAYS